MAGSFPSVGTLVPHREPALLLTAVQELVGDGIVCFGAIPLEHPLVDQSRAPAILGVELAAQAAAAYEKLRRTCGAAGWSESDLGYLVSISECRFSSPSVIAGRLLRATVHLVGSAGPLCMYRGIVETAEARGQIVACRFSTYRVNRTRARESRTTDEASDV
jgi:predicted hotdog family 3-hydroxylacyl-ACP dehydratase